MSEDAMATDDQVVMDGTLPTPERLPVRRSRRRLVVVVLLLVGLPLAVKLSFETLRLWAGAASDCEVFEAGARFGVTVFVWPALSMVLWACYSVPLIVLRRRFLVVGVVVGVIVALAFAFWFVSGTGAMIRADPDGAEFCPTGVPDWWPSWLPR